MRVRWLRTALRNLDEEARYIATDDDGAARPCITVAAARSVSGALA